MGDESARNRGLSRVIFDGTFLFRESCSTARISLGLERTRVARSKELVHAHEIHLVVAVQDMGNQIARHCALSRPKGPTKGSAEWIKAQVVQRNTAS